MMITLYAIVIKDAVEIFAVEGVGACRKCYGLLVRKVTVAIMLKEASDVWALIQLDVIGNEATHV